MIEVNENPELGILAFRVSGKLTQEELDGLIPALKKHASTSDDPHILMIMENFDGWEDTAAFWKDLQIDTQYIGYFDRVAIVGDKRWQKWGAQLVNPINEDELKFFSIDKAEDAWNWIQENHR